MSDRFDELLDKVLREESAVEPLAGLEERVMARVGEASVPVARRWMFAAWAGGLGVAAAVIALVVLLPERHQVRPVHHAGLAAGVVGEVPSGAKENAEEWSGSGEVPSAAKAAFSNDGLSTRLKSRPFKANARAELRRASVALDEEARLPKLDVFPSPAPADVFPTPVVEGQEAAAVSISPKAAEALLALQKEQAGPIQVAAIVIAPLNPER